MAQQIQQALKNTYLNSAAIYVKQERWGRALESAKAAQKYEQCVAPFPHFVVVLPARRR